MQSFVISPELALVDPEARATGISLLGQDLVYSPVLPAVPPVEGLPRAARRRRAVAVTVYAASAAVRMLLLDAMFVIVVGVLVLVLSLIG
jgi:hypothetical protein